MLRSVSLSVEPGEVRALVGESGAGKSMIGKAVLGVLPPSVKIVEGAIRLEGQDLGALSAKERRRVIGAKTALIPQDPLTALNPSRRVGPQMTDRLDPHPRLAGRARRQAHPAAARRGAYPRTGSCHARPIRTSFPAACASAC